MNGKSNILTHHQTITLGGIHSLTWVSQNHPLGSQGNVLATGHNSGLAHFILLPDPYSNNVPAEIVRRFNHNRHLQKSSGSTRIKHLQLSNDVWTCTPLSSLITMCSEHIFLWDPSRSDIPMLRKKCKGATCFDASELRSGILGMGGAKGISIRDIRAHSSSGLSPPTDNDGRVSMVKWSPNNENLMAAVHDSTTIKVWDIRSHGPLATFDGHTDQINSIRWASSATAASPSNNSTLTSGELYSASNDGTIRVWSVGNNNESAAEYNSSRDSIQPLPDNNNTPTSKKDLEWIQNKPWKLYRQRLSKYDDDSTVSCQYFIDRSRHSFSSTIFSATKQFLKLAAIQTSRSPLPSLISVDSEGYFGLHTKDVFSFELDYSGASDPQSSEDDFVPSLSTSPTSFSSTRRSRSSDSSASF